MKGETTLEDFWQVIYSRTNCSLLAWMQIIEESGLRSQSEIVGFLTREHNLDEILGTKVASAYMQLKSGRSYAEMVL